MTDQHERNEWTKARLIAQELEEQGYTVTLEPDPSLIPFSLTNYRPDILATGTQENLIVEVRTRDDTRSIERYRLIAEEIGKHKGWRFMLSTIDEPYQIESAEIKHELSNDAISRALARVDALLRSENYEMAVPYLWTVYISGMRSAGRQQGLPMDATTDRSVVNYMYSMGLISAFEYNESIAFLSTRNKMIHTFETSLGKNEVQRLVDFTKGKLHEWGIIGE
jgi:hypothetical protein